MTTWQIVLALWWTPFAAIFALIWIGESRAERNELDAALALMVLEEVEELVE